LHQAEKYVKQIAEEIGRPSYMQEFLKQGRDKKAVTEVAEKLKQFTENMSLLQPIAVKGFMVPSGSLMLYHYLLEDLEAIEAVLTLEKPGNPGAGKKKGREPAQSGAEPENLSAAQKEELKNRVGIVKHRLNEMTESLLPQHIADQIEQRTDEKAAREAFQEQGFLPLYVDEKTMGIVFNTLTMQLLLDRFNLIFEGVFAPMDQGTVNSIIKNVLAPFWKKHDQSILFSMEEGKSV